MGVQINGDTGNISATKADYSGNVTIGGTLTYEDVTNIDSVGLDTARQGIEVGSGVGVAASISVDGNAEFAGIVTATQFVGNGANLTGVASTENIRTNTNATFLQNVNVSGSTTTGSLVSSGAISGTTGTFTGDVDIADKIVHTGDTDTAIRFPSADTITTETGGSERLRITSNGDVGINCTPAADSKLQIKFGTNLHFHFNSGQDSLPTINSIQDAGAYNGMVLRSDNLRIFTGVSPSERMRILSGGSTLIGRTSATSFGSLLQVKSIDVETDGDTTGMFFNRTDSTAAWVAMRFHVQQSQQGYIQVNSSSVTYSTSSDYRLKENEVLISDGITRLKQLKPYRFNWKTDTSKKVDGFFAHEVNDIVPEAIGGEKDAVDKDGNPDYQVIDHSKLVPLLTAALQEAVSEIETLKTEVAALKSQLNN